MSSAGDHDDGRPAAPDESLVEEAAESLSTLGRNGRLSWAPGEVIDRPGSRVFPLRLGSGPDSAVAAYYKVLLEPRRDDGSDARRLEVTRAGLERQPVLEARFAESIAGEGIVFSQTLAMDVERLITVTLAVEGREFGRPWRNLLTSESRARAHHTLERAGRAARLIEDTESGEFGPGQDHEAARLERRLRKLGAAIPAMTLSRLEARASDLYEEVLSGPRPITIAHGDVSSTNLLVGEHVGLIDFSWIPRIRSFDVASFAFRLDYHDVVSNRLSGELKKSLLGGYGVPDLEESPQWRLIRFSNLLKVIRRGDGRRGPQGWLARRAVAEIEDL